MDALIEAAKAEGELNVIALPPDWANYGEMLETFSEKYDIEINSATPDGSSQDELNAVTSQRGQDRAPDVLDLGHSFARQAKAQDLTAPYKVATWDDIPEGQRDPDGHWFNDYGGYLSIGCNATIVEVCPTTLAELARPPATPVRSRSTATRRRPQAAFAGVWAAALATAATSTTSARGSTSSSTSRRPATSTRSRSTPATIQAGETPHLASTGTT